MAIGKNASVILLGLALAALLGLSYGAGRTLLFVLFMAIPVAVAVVWRPQLAFQLILVIAFTVDYAAYLFGWPSQVIYVVDGLILILACGVLTQAALQKRVRWGSPLLILWILVLVLTALVGGRHDLYSVQSLVGYAVFPVLYLALINMKLERSIERRIATILLVLVVLQAPVTVVQKYAFGLTNVDRIGGTLGRAGTPALAVLMAGLLAFFLSYLACHRRWRLFPVLVVPIIPMLLGEAKAGFVLASLGAAILLVLLVWQRASWKGVAVTAMFVILPLGVAYVAYRYYAALFLSSAGYAPRFLDALFTKQGFVDYMSGSYGGQANRLTGFEVIWRNLGDSQARSLGLGPGALSTSTFFGQAAEPTISGLMRITSAGRYLAETGLVGLSTFCLAVLYLVAQTGRLVRSSETYQRVLGMTFVVGGILFLVGGFYAFAWNTSAVAASFWTLAGLAYRETSRLKKGLPVRRTVTARGPLESVEGL